jgi:hypothetical protein
MALSSKSDVLNYQGIFAAGTTALRLNQEFGIKLSESKEWEVFLNHFKKIDKFSLPTKPDGYEITEERLNVNLKYLKDRIKSEDYKGALRLVEIIFHDIHSVYQDV